MIRGLLRCTVFVVFAVLLHGVAFAADSSASVTVPDSVKNGEGFFVRIATLGKPEEVAVEWRDTIVPVDMQVSGSGYEGLALLGVPMDVAVQSLPVFVTVRYGELRSEFNRTIRIEKKQYPEQHLTVKRKYVNLPQKSLDRHYAEKKRTGEVLERLTPHRGFGVSLLRPVSGGVSSEFGMRRFFNGEPRKPHSGVDLRGAEGTPIKATSGGIVRLAEEHYFSGNVVYIDHGQGVVSMYAHMSQILVTPGQEVRRGEVIGKVGKTGRVTGPHLHFGLSVQGTLIDPLPLLHNE